MKNILKKILLQLGILPYIQVFRERYFPTSYLLQSRQQDEKYMKFYSQFIKPDDLCFDIGAHRGHRTNVFLKLGARVVAIEPQKDLYKYLKVKFGKRIHAENMGLGSEERILKMYISNDSTLSTFSDEWVNKAKSRFINTSWDKQQLTKISTLDNLIHKYGKPKFCKIDVEGFEYEVLKGLNVNITYLSFEFMTPENISIITNCLEKLYAINKNITINFSYGDSMELALLDWLHYEMALNYFSNNLFNGSFWGDIYVKMPN